MLSGVRRVAKDNILFNYGVLQVLEANKGWFLNTFRLNVECQFVLVQVNESLTGSILGCILVLHQFCVELSSNVLDIIFFQFFVGYFIFYVVCV